MLPLGDVCFLMRRRARLTLTEMSRQSEISEEAILEMESGAVPCAALWLFWAERGA